VNARRAASPQSQVRRSRARMGACEGGIDMSALALPSASPMDAVRDRLTGVGLGSCRDRAADGAGNRSSVVESVVPAELAGAGADRRCAIIAFAVIASIAEGVRPRAVDIIGQLDRMAGGQAVGDRPTAARAPAQDGRRACRQRLHPRRQRAEVG
jgi:hypothetical protein